MNRGPSCDCAGRSSDNHVFTCPICVRFALAIMDAQLAQMEMFEYIDGVISVSALVEGEGTASSVDDGFCDHPEDGLPF